LVRGWSAPLCAYTLTVLAIAAVTDIALNAGTAPIRGKVLAMRLGLPNRYLEEVLQALERHDILESTTGSRGGYKLARQPSRITADDIYYAPSARPLKQRRMRCSRTWFCRCWHKPRKLLRRACAHQRRGFGVVRR
jgi:Rrf2 family protein